jgi:hypothetical protein
MIAANHRARGRTVLELDSQIAAIALSCGAYLAARIIRDFEGSGVDLMNPWEWRK